jgi:hypothetical protein
MSGQYFLDELSKRWVWGNLDPEIVRTRSEDILADWKSISIQDADAAVQLLRNRDYHRGNFMPTADELHDAVVALRRPPTAATASAHGQGWHPADPMVSHRHSDGRRISARDSWWKQQLGKHKSIDAVIDDDDRRWQAKNGTPGRGAAAQAAAVRDRITP